MGLSWLKTVAVLFGSIPFMFIGLFFLAGGPCPASVGGHPIRLIGIPVFLAGVIWALPAGLLRKIKPGVGNLFLFYGLPGVFTCYFFGWLISSTVEPSLFRLSIWGLIALTGIGSAAWYHVRVWKKEEKVFHYVKSY